MATQPLPAREAPVVGAGTPPITTSFLYGHPDLRFRMLGLEDFRQGNYADALAFFRRASYYGDKPSQGMVAEMLHDGRGTAPDPVQAYVWMDLAAERGYRGFLGLRERYWNELDEAQRARAIEEGQPVFAEYGDAATQPRLARMLRRERLKMTGSRAGNVGNVGNLRVYVNVDNGYVQIDGSKFYDKRLWDPALYREWQDSIWMSPRIGTVTVGAPEQIDQASRIPAAAPEFDAPEPVTPERDESGLGKPRDD